MSGGVRGLTWDHPRGVDALRAAAEQDPRCDLRWDVQPLEGFESAPIAENAAAYDLVVLDHPHLGEAIASDALRPLDELFGEAELQEWRDGTVGPSFTSYEVDGRPWGLPLDAATQVSATADAGVPAPTSWDEAVALSREVPSVLPTTGPHLFLTLCSVALSHGHVPGEQPDVFLPEPVVAEALDTLRAFVDPAVSRPATHNPITVLEQMSIPGGPVYCPHVYGYVTYSRGTGRPVTFHDAPTGRSGRHGSVLGGTGVAISRRLQPDETLLDHVRWLMAERTQREFVPAHAGQPSRASAWADDAVNAESRNFYRGTIRTMQEAWIRPRHDGAVAFQQAAADVVRRAVLEGHDHAPVAAALTRLHHDSLDRAQDVA